MQPVIVIAGYKPKPGKNQELRELMKTHLEILAGQGLVTDRKSIICEAKDGTVLEVFEWKSQEHIDQAHSNPAVQKMWEDYAEVCEYIPMGQVAEASELFSGFTPLN